MKIGANTTFWLNTDQNTSTGYQIWGFAGGAEYNVNIGADGKLALYSGAAGQTLVSSAIDYSLSADGTALEFAVPSALLPAGAPHALNAYIDVNDQVFLSRDYASVPYKVAETVVTPPPVVGTLTLDGSLADWSAANRLDTPADGVAGYEVYGQYTGNDFVFALKTNGTKIGTNTTFWLNTDQNTSTGYQICGFAGGAEYNVNIGADGKLALDSGAAGQTLVSTAIDYSLSADGTVLEFAVPSALLTGAPHALTTYVDVNDQVFLSNNYAGVSYKVAETVVTPPPVVGTLTLDGSLADWTAADRLTVTGTTAAGYELYSGLGQFPRRRGGGWVRQIALTSFLPGAVVIDFPDDLCAAA